MPNADALQRHYSQADENNWELSTQQFQREHNAKMKADELENRRITSEQSLADETYWSLHLATLTLAELKKQRTSYEDARAEVERLTTLLEDSRSKGFVARLEVAQQRSAEVTAKAEADHQESRRVSTRDGLAYQEYATGYKRTPQTSAPKPAEPTQVCHCGAIVPLGQPLHKLAANEWCITSLRGTLKTGRDIFWCLQNGATVQELLNVGIKPERLADYVG